ncbi:MAG: class I SAM-dependent methyltransferase [Thermomicrobiales bacterium]
MRHEDHVRLIAAGIEPGEGGAWGDFGAGSGAFTLSLRDLAGPESEIIAVDRDRASLRDLERVMMRQFPGTRLQTLTADVTAALALPPLDGILAANVIHYTRHHDQAALLARWPGYLKPAGRLILVEYDAETGNRWVPYPLSFRRLQAIAAAAGFAAPALLGVAPSRFLERLYAAMLAPLRPETAEDLAG